MRKLVRFSRKATIQQIVKLLSFFCICGNGLRLEWSSSLFPMCALVLVFSVRTLFPESFVAIACCPDDGEWLPWVRGESTD